MVAVFSLLAVTPVMMIYLFSVQFLHRSVDNWLDVRIEQALEGALELSRASLHHNMRERLKQVELLAVQLSDLPEPAAADRLYDTFEMLGASEVTLMSSKGRVIATSTNTTALVPAPPDEAVLLQVRQSGTYIGLDPIDEIGLVLRVVVNIASPAPGQEPRAVQALFPIAKHTNELASGVRTAFERYQDLIYLRAPLKTSFMLTLSLVLLVSLLSAVWAAVFAARRLTAPLRRMAELTRSVAAGDYETRLPDKGSNEIGFLADSFNDMTRKLSLGARRGPGQPPAARGAAHLPRSGVVTPLLGGAHHRPRRPPGDVQPDGERHSRHAARASGGGPAPPAGPAESAARPVRRTGGGPDPRRPAGLA